MLERCGDAGKREGRLSVKERRRSWFASRVCERVCGPKDWKRERNEVAIVDAEASEVDEEKRRWERRAWVVRRDRAVHRQAGVERNIFLTLHSAGRLFVTMRLRVVEVKYSG